AWSKEPVTTNRHDAAVRTVIDGHESATDVLGEERSEPGLYRPRPGWRRGRETQGGDAGGHLVGLSAEAEREAEVDTREQEGRDRRDHPQRQPEHARLSEARHTFPARGEVTLIVASLPADDLEQPLPHRLQLALTSLHDMVAALEPELETDVHQL